jgi:hypothetical protein
MSEWQPINADTKPGVAPFDGVPVLICTNHNWGGDTNRVHRAYWTNEIHGSDIFGWAVQDCKFGPYALRGYTVVTHWMPLPPPPAERSQP